MNRRGFIKALTAGVATLALTTRLAQSAIDVCFPALRDGMDITDILQGALNRAAPGETVVLPMGSYFTSDTITIPAHVGFNASHSMIEAVKGAVPEYMFKKKPDARIYFENIHIRGGKCAILLEASDGAIRGGSIWGENDLAYVSWLKA